MNEVTGLIFSHKQDGYNTKIVTINNSRWWTRTYLPTNMVHIFIAMKIAVG